MQVVERLRSCEAACELLEKYNMSYTQETNWMDELDSKLRNLEELEEARAKEAWEKQKKKEPKRADKAEDSDGSGGSWASVRTTRSSTSKREHSPGDPSMGNKKKNAQQSPAGSTK